VAEAEMNTKLTYRERAALEMMIDDYGIIGVVEVRETFMSEIEDTSGEQT
jgi:hypothetical protein